MVGEIRPGVNDLLRNEPGDSGHLGGPGANWHSGGWGLGRKPCNVIEIIVEMDLYFSSRKASRLKYPIYINLKYKVFPLRVY